MNLVELGIELVAGSSGIAGLAQSMANQGQLQAQQISASIGAQETTNKRMAAQGAASIQQAERAGAGAVDMQIRQGDAMVQQAESGRQATILAAQYGQAAGAKPAKRKHRSKSNEYAGYAEFV